MAVCVCHWVVCSRSEYITYTWPRAKSIQTTHYWLDHMTSTSRAMAAAKQAAKFVACWTQYFSWLLAYSTS